MRPRARHCWLGLITTLGLSSLSGSVGHGGGPRGLGDRGARVGGVPLGSLLGDADRCGRVLRLRGGGETGPAYGPDGTCYGRECASPKMGSFFPLPCFSILTPSDEKLREMARQQPDLTQVPMRGATRQANLFAGRRLNPQVFPLNTFINERRAFLNRRFDFTSKDPNVGGGEYIEDPDRCWNRALYSMKNLDFMDLDWCSAVREKDHIVIAPKVFGIWTTMTNKVLKETYQENSKFARATLSFGMTTKHLLHGEEMFALTWDKGSGAVAFEVCSFSWPQHPTAAIFEPVVHWFQRKAVQAFCEKMQETVHERVFEMKAGRVRERAPFKVRNYHC